MVRVLSLLSGLSLLAQEYGLACLHTWKMFYSSVAKTPSMLWFQKIASCVALAVACTSCTTASLPVPIVPEELRPHDSRAFTPPAIDSTFAAMPTLPADVVAMASSSRWAGVLKGAAYMVEVPASWNGKLVMFAHGYAGTGAALIVSPPPIRRHLIQSGYAWAASSYSTNYYDVRAGIEDTNALALAFNAIAAQNGRPLAAPVRTYITGRSMGGHIAAAAVERETLTTAVNKVNYHAALPMCGVMAGADLFSIFAGMQVAAQALAGVPGHPFAQWADVQTQVSSSLFTSFPTAASPTLPIVTTAKGSQFASVVKNLTGGERPMFDQGFEYGGSYRFAYGGFGGDGTINGILSQNILDTQALRYVIDGDLAASNALNASAQKLTAQPDANRLRRDGLRWIPSINGEFKVPVLSMHTLGDLYVPFGMQQSYARRAFEKGSKLLVQRAQRGAAHCDFTVAEQVESFEALAQWEQGGTKPPGDDVLTAAVLAAPSYGCTFTNNATGPDDVKSTVDLRARIAATTPACPARGR